MKRGGGLHPARPDCWPPTKRPRATPGGLIAASVTCLSCREGVPPCLRTSPPLGGTLEVHRTSKACMHVLGTRVPRRLGVARSASSPKAAQALGCSLTPGLRILFPPGHLHGTGCLSARAMGTGFPTVVRRLCLGPGCGLVWVLLTPPVLAGVLGGCVWARFVVLSLFCRLFVVFVVGLRFWPAYGTCVVLCALRLLPAVSGSGVRCGRACWARVSAVPRPSWLGCRGVFFALFLSWFGFVVSVAGCFCPGPCGPCPPIPFLSGWAAGCFFFSWCVSACFGVPFPGGPLFLAWCCRFWLGGPPVPLWGSCLQCLLGGGFGRLLWCWRAVWWLWAVFPPPPPSSPCFFLGGGPACSSLCLPWAGARTGPHSVWSSGLLLAVAFCLAVFWPHASGVHWPSCCSSSSSSSTCWNSKKKCFSNSLGYSLVVLEVL